MDSIKEKEELETIPKKLDQDILKQLRLDENIALPKDTNIKNILMSIKGIGTDTDDQPKKLIPNNINQVLANFIQNKSSF